MKKMMKLSLALALGLSLSGCGSDGGTSSSDGLNVGVLQLAEHPALDATYEGFLKGLEDHGYKEGNDFSIDFQNAQGESSNCETIADKFVNNKMDLIFAIATPSAQAVAAKTTDIPVVVSAITDPASAGLVETNEAPGGNVTGSSDLTPVEDQIDLLLDIVPDAKKVAVMYSSSEDNSIFQADIAKQVITDLGLEVVEATVADSSSIQQVTESLVGKVDAVYIPTDNLLAEYMSTVAMVANENNLPVIPGEGGMVTNGGIATYGVDYFEIGYAAGVQAAKILKGESQPATMPIEYVSADNCSLIVNQKVANQLGITIPDKILSDATIVGE